MLEHMRIAVIGGDERQIFAARTLREKGLEVVLFGMSDAAARICPTLTSDALEDAVSNADAVILPLPSSTDGVRLYCPLDPHISVRLTEILHCMRKRLLLGGRLSEHFCKEAAHRDVICIDYFHSEELQLRNALPTAEGAIYLAMRELPVTLFGTSAAIVGYGRIGSVLAQRLKALGMRVYVYARRRESLVLAEIQGMIPMPLLGEGKTSSLKALPKDCRVLFNTVPARLIERDVLEKMPRECVLIDLASVPGGVDQIVAKEMGFQSIWGTALPGKCTPESAGKILGEAWFQILSEHLPLEASL